MQTETTDTKVKNGKGHVTSTDSEVRMLPFGKLTYDKEVNYRTANPSGKVPLKELAKSIQENGLLEPLIVYPTKEGFKVGVGGRRFTALTMNKTKADVPIPCVIRTAAAQPIDALIENIQREDPYALDLAERLRKLVEGTYPTVDGTEAKAWTRNELAERLSMSQQNVQNLVRAATNLSDEVKKLCYENQVPMRFFITLGSKKPEEQLEALKEFIKLQKAKAASTGPKRKKRSQKEEEEGGAAAARAPIDTLKGELAILIFKMTYAKGKEAELTERQIDTLRYVIGGENGLARMPGLTGEDRKAYAKHFKEMAEAEEVEESEDE